LLQNLSWIHWRILSRWEKDFELSDEDFAELRN